MARMSHKLTGRDFSTSSLASANSIPHTLDHSNLISGDIHEVDHGLSVKLQVQKLILQATSSENLCQNYVGYDFMFIFTLVFSHLHTAPNYLNLCLEIVQLHPSSSFLRHGPCKYQCNCYLYCLIVAEYRIIS